MRGSGVVAAALALATSGLAAAGAGPAGAAGADLAAAAAPLSLPGILSGAAATSARSAWAVGQTGSGQVLILRWNGTAWRQQASPVPGAGALASVAATSARNAWAVGHRGTGASATPLLLHWNGRRWRQEPGHAPAGGGALDSVAATSAGNAWAAGSSGAATLILHWNGRTWARQSSANFGNVYDVAGSSARNAWAATTSDLLHWTGASWAHVPTPSPPGCCTAFTGVATTSRTDAWGIGSYSSSDGHSVPSLIVHWNGTTWKQVPSPFPGGVRSVSLAGVTAASPGRAWAAGSSFSELVGNKTIIDRWNGTAWTHVRTPNVGSGFLNSSYLSAVAAASATSAWAVGYSSAGAGTRILIMGWNGTAWRQVRGPKPR